MNKHYEELTNKIISTYEAGVTLDEAERLAAEFLHAMLSVSEELKSLDLDSRMRRAGLKAVKASVYLAHAVVSDGKKPTEAMLGATVDSNEIVQKEQDALDKAESSRDNLDRYYNIFKEAHVHFRGVSKGRFNG